MLHADYLEAVADTIGLTRPGVSILELGSGVGFVSMCLAANLPHASRITATEQAEGGAVEWLLSNISQNSHLNLRHLHVSVCDWNSFAICDTDKVNGHRAMPLTEENCQTQDSEGANVREDGDCWGMQGQQWDDTGLAPERCFRSGKGSKDGLAAHSRSLCEEEQFAARANPSAAERTCNAAYGDAVSSKEILLGDNTVSETKRGAPMDRPCTSQSWDFIFGSDLVYNEAGCELLPRTLAALASEQTQVLYAHTKRRFEMLDCDFFANLLAAGLEYEEVREPWAASPPPSPPAFTSLFPEMRIAVFRIFSRRS